MANLANALKEEIGRLAQKEVRQQTAGTVKSTAQCEREIAVLKRQVQDLRRELSSLRSQERSRQTESKKTSKSTATGQKNGKATGAAPAPARQSARTSSFSADRLKAHRERLGLSADNYGKLIGVSGLSIYNWEQERARPRKSSIEALMSIKGLGKRKAKERLEALTKEKEQENQRETENGAAQEGEATSTS